MRYPALLIRDADPELAVAVVDEFSPTAVEDRDGGVMIFFPSSAGREQARVALAADLPNASVTVHDIDDEDWARRSQQNLTPITVGRILVTPPWFASSDVHSPPQPPASNLLTIVINPSMGFGTGHHATTRLCLAALQSLDLRGKRVLDVGTGSALLAIAAARLGASEVLAIDSDKDAIDSARENIDANPDAGGIRLEIADFRDRLLPEADVVLANLTGAVLVQNADVLRAAVAPGGRLVVSGLQRHEREDVVGAFPRATLLWEETEADWVGLGFG